MRAGEVARVPAGSAMAVDRDVFSAEVQRELAALPNLEIVREKVDALPAAGLTIVATGPLTAASLAESIGAATGADSLAFFDAIAPIVHHDSIDMDVCWMAARWDKGGKDYINCPMDKEQYLAFHQGLLDGEKTEFKEWEANTPYFEGCMPIEVMAERGVETLALRADEAGRARQPALGDARASRPGAGLTRWSSCGRTTSSARCGTWSASRPSSSTPSRCGCSARSRGSRTPSSRGSAGCTATPSSIRRRCSTASCGCKSAPHIRFAGQITGCEGYVESSAVGLLAGLMAAAELGGREWASPPRTTAMGALLAHITGDAEAESYQPMNVNFGLFPPLPEVKKKQRKEAYTERAKADFGDWLADVRRARARLSPPQAAAAPASRSAFGAVVANSFWVSSPSPVGVGLVEPLRRWSPPIPRTSAGCCRPCRGRGTRRCGSRASRCG